MVLAWPGQSANAPRSAEYYLLNDCLVAVFGGVRLFKIPFSDIEYVGYTAENSFLGGARYVPVGGGILCLTTKPGFLVTVDFRHSHLLKSGRFLRVPVRRVLLTLDEPRDFLENLRTRVS